MTELIESDMDVTICYDAELHCYVAYRGDIEYGVPGISYADAYINFLNLLDSLTLIKRK